MSLAHEAASLGQPPGGDVGLVAPEADALRAEVTEGEGEGGPHGLGAEAPGLVVDVDEVAELELGEAPGDDADVDLGDELARAALPRPEEERAPGRPVGGEGGRRSSASASEVTDSAGLPSSYGRRCVRLRRQSAR